MVLREPAYSSVQSQTLFAANYPFMSDGDFKILYFGQKPFLALPRTLTLFSLNGRF